MIHMRRVVVAAAAAAVLALAVPAVSQADESTGNSGQIEYGIDILCANGGAGEHVQLTGFYHVIYKTTYDANGGAHYIIHKQFAGVRGYGSVTGDKYQLTGSEELETTNFTAGGASEGTFVGNLQVIGQGPGNNLLGSTTVHFTINANGVYTVFYFQNGHGDCR
jgi:hypothetical protein